MLQKQQ